LIELADKVSKTAEDHSYANHMHADDFNNAPQGTQAISSWIKDRLSAEFVVHSDTYLTDQAYQKMTNGATKMPSHQTAANP